MRQSSPSADRCAGTAPSGAPTIDGCGSPRIHQLSRAAADVEHDGLASMSPTPWRQIRFLVT
jgi:hypothetical protein